MKSRYEVGHGGFSSAAAAYQRNRPARRHGDVEITHHWPASAILEFHLIETKLANYRRRIDSIGPVWLILFHPQHFKDAFHGGQRTLQLGERIDNVPHGVQQQKSVPLKRHDIA